MNIACVVFSSTGNTLSVAKQLAEGLSQSGHKVESLRIETAGAQKPTEPGFRFTNLPELSGYDGYIFASYVEAFSLNPIMREYLKGLENLSGKPSHILVTQHFKSPFFGGNNAVRKMKALLEKNGASIRETAIINWTNPGRPTQIEDARRRLCNGF